MSVKVSDLMITSIETITAFDIRTGAWWFTLDELQDATINQTQEKVDITGKQGRKLSSMKRNKAVTVSGTNGVVSGGLIEAQTGTGFENKDTQVKWYDYLTVNSNKATTTFKAIGTAGNEIECVYVKDTDGSVKEILTQDAAAAAGKFAYAPENKELTFSGIEDGTEIVVYYTRKINAFVHENYSDKYSDKAMLYIDAMAEDKCANIFHVQIFIPKADFNGEFSLEFGDNQTVQAFEAESLAGGGCAGTSTGKGLFWTFTVFGENTEDVA